MPNYLKMIDFFNAPSLLNCFAHSGGSFVADLAYINGVGKNKRRIRSWVVIPSCLGQEGHKKQTCRFALGGFAYMCVSLRNSGDVLLTLE